MRYMELVDIRPIKSKLIALYSPGDAPVTEGDSMLNKVFRIIDEADVYTVNAPNKETKPAEWSAIERGLYRCSNCTGIAESRSYFCPNCGVAMRRE